MTTSNNNQVQNSVEENPPIPTPVPVPTPISDPPSDQPVEGGYFSDAYYELGVSDELMCGNKESSASQD